MPIRIIAYTLLCLLLFSACAAPASEAKVETVSVDGVTLTVTFDPGTLSAGTIQTEHGQYTFRYESPDTIVIQYPDGYVYEQTNISGGIATPADYDGAERIAKGYLDGFSLVWGIEGAADQARNTRSGDGPSPFLALLLLGLGPGTCSPRKAPGGWPGVGGTRTRSPRIWPLRLTGSVAFAS